MAICTKRYSISRNSPPAPRMIGDLRGRHRILRFAAGHWLLFQQRDIDHVLRRPCLFSSRYGPLLDDFPEQLLAEQRRSITSWIRRGHRLYRSLRLSRPSGGPALRQREPLVRALAATGRERGPPHRAVRVCGRSGSAAATRVIFAVLGVPPKDFARVAALANALALAMIRSLPRTGRPASSLPACSCSTARSLRPTTAARRATA